MSKDHILPLFVGDFLASTGTWDGYEAGTYALLLMHQWASGSLPKEPSKLAGVLQIPVGEFMRMWPTLAPKFQLDGGRLRNPRLEHIRADNEARQDARIKKAQLASAARWGGSEHAPSNATRNPQSNAPSTPKGDAPSNAPSITSVAVQDAPSNASDPILSESTPNRTEKEGSAEGPAVTAAPEQASPEAGVLGDAVQKTKKPVKARKLPSFEFDRADYPTVSWSAFEDFVEHRQIIGKAIRPKGAKYIVELLARFTADQQAQMVRYSRVGGYSGLYEPRGGSNGASAPKVHVRSVAELEAEARAAGQDPDEYWRDRG